MYLDSIYTVVCFEKVGIELPVEQQQQKSLRVHPYNILFIFV